MLAGVCCVGSAVAVGAGIAGLSFFSTWMDRYQTYLIVASVVLMLLWIIGLVRRQRSTGATGRAVGRWLLRHVAVMGIVYAVTLGLAFAAAGLAGSL